MQKVCSSNAGVCCDLVVRLPLLLSIMPAPVMRSMVSKLVLSSEQGKKFLHVFGFLSGSPVFSLCPKACRCMSGWTGILSQVNSPALHSVLQNLAIDPPQSDEVAAENERTHNNTNKQIKKYIETSLVQSSIYNTIR